MTAFVWTGPRTFAQQDVEVRAPLPGEVVLKVVYSGICGSDLSGYLGENSLRKPPLVMGHEFTGTVQSLGTGVQRLKVGDLVTVNPLLACGDCADCRNGFPQYCPERQIIGIHQPGSYADRVVVPEMACHPVRDALMGSLVEPLACGVRAARQAMVGLGDTVVVYGAGIIGLFALQVSTWMGAKHRILVDTNDARLQFGTRFGATHTVNPRNGDLVSLVADLSPRGADKVIDAVGLTATRQGAVDVLRSGGRVVWIGLHEDDTRVAGNVIVRKEVEIVGCFCYTDDDFRQALALVEAGRLDPAGGWFDVRPMNAIGAAFDEQIDGPAIYPKIILGWDVSN